MSPESARDRLRGLAPRAGRRVRPVHPRVGQNQHLLHQREKDLLQLRDSRAPRRFAVSGDGRLRRPGVGGLEVGANRLVTAGDRRCHRAGRSVEGFFVRKQAKGHGSQECVAGRVHHRDRVAVIDDVPTTGDPVAQAVVEVEKLGAKVVRVVCIVDRLQGARERLAGFDYRPLFIIRNFGIEPNAT